MARDMWDRIVESVRIPISLRVASIAAVALAGGAAASASDLPLEPTPLELVTTCAKSSWFTSERGTLSKWAEAADGNITSEEVSAREQLEVRGMLTTYRFTTDDKRTLGGFRLTRNSGPQGDTAVLVAGGNVATAEAMAVHFAALAEAVPHHYYFVDYRGYGRSKPAIPSFAAFMADFAAIAIDLRNRGYKRVLAYGASFGGVILLNAAARGAPFDRVIADSVPSSLAGYDCPADLYPVNLLPKVCPQVTAITAVQDYEVNQRAQRMFLQGVRGPNCGGDVVALTTAWHVTNEPVGSPQHKERISAITATLQRP